MVSKNNLLESLNQFYGANLILSSDVDQDTTMFGLHESPSLIHVSSPRTYKSRYKKEIKQR